MKKRLHLALGALVPVVVAGCSGGADGPGTGGVGNAPGAGGTASGGAATGGSGGISSGGVGTGGVEGDGGASGGWGGGGGLPLPVEGAEFVRCFPWGTLPPQMGPLLAATPSGSVLVLGPSAPPGLFPESPGLPFLLELDASGVVLQSFAIPDAPGPEIMTIAEDGTVYFAGQAGPGVIGAQPVPAVPSGYYLAKLSPTFEVLAVTAVESPSTQVNAMHVDLAGDLVVGTAIADFEAGSMKPAVTKFFGDTLEQDWSVTFEHEIMPALIYGMDTLPDGRIAVAGLYSRTLTVGSFVLEKDPEGQDDDFAYAGWVAWLSPLSGEPLLAETFGGAVSDGVSDLVVTPSGTLRLLTTHAPGSLTLFGTELEFEDNSYALVDLDVGGQAERIVTFGETGKTAFALALGADGQTYVAGGYGDPLADVSSRGAELLRIEADGALGESSSLSTGHALREIAVDTEGGLWISGGWETPFDWDGGTEVPSSPIPEEACRLVLRTTSF